MSFNNFFIYYTTQNVFFKWKKSKLKNYGTCHTHVFHFQNKTTLHDLASTVINYIKHDFDVVWYVMHVIICCCDQQKLLFSLTGAPLQAGGFTP